MQSFGITRIARITGLDRCGVEVACAIRPGGHILQVSNGKGSTFRSAAIGALCEAAELWGAEQLNPLALRWGSIDEMSAATEVWVPDLLPNPWDRRTRFAWRSARSLADDREIYVPAHQVHCPPSNGMGLGPDVCAWTSNGMGAHFDRLKAIQHALLEAIEWDQLARVLPQGWTATAINRRKMELSPSKLPNAFALREQLSKSGFEPYLFNLMPTKKTSLGLPVVGALLFGEAGSPLPLTAGYACRLGWDDAFCAALREAAQSRLTDIHGAREDLVGADLDFQPSVDALRKDCRRKASTPEMHRARLQPGLKPSTSIALILKKLKRGGYPRVAVADLAPPGSEIQIVKVLIPGLLLSELL